MSLPVVLLLGAGSNVGEAVIKHVSKQGFKVAVVSRSRKDGLSPEGVLNIAAGPEQPRRRAYHLQQGQIPMGPITHRGHTQP